MRPHALPTAAALACHGLGLALFVNWRDVIDNPPIHYVDYAAHYAGVFAVKHFLDRGRLWGYDPFFHAGYPAGTLFDLDNKGVEVASYVLNRLGLSLPHAFNVVVLGLMALAPLAVWAAARSFGLSPLAAGLSQWLVLAAWYGDRAVRWMWQGSILAFASAALGSLLVAAAFWGWARGQARHARLNLLVWFGLGPALFWIHPGAFLTLAVLLGALAVFACPRWRGRQWAIVAAWCLWVVAVNWPWLGTALRFLPTRTATDLYLQGGLAQLGADVRAPHFALRVVIGLLAVLGLGLWRRQGQPLWRPVLISLCVWVVLAYAGAWLGAGAVQPYRLILPALALGTLPAADGLLRLPEISPRWAAAAVLAILLAAGTALYAGRPQGLRLADGTPSDHLGGPQPDEWAVCRTLGRLDLMQGRVLVNEWRLGAWLPACSGAQVLGGPFHPVWTLYGYANAGLETVLGRPVEELSISEMASSLDRYNVRWVVVNGAIPGRFTLADWERDHPGLLVLLASHGAFLIYEVRQPASWFFSGTGQVAAGYNRLDIRDAGPGGLVLKYHWIDGLHTDPPLTMWPQYVGADPAPFIAIDNGPVADFAIVLDDD